MDKLIPHQASHRIADLLSDNSSNETKAQTARWFAEMMIKDFLSDEFTEGGNHKELSLGELISKLNGRLDSKIIDALNLIKEFGDKASHYNPDIKLSSSDSKKAVDAAFDLFPLLIINHLRKSPLNSHPDRATLLSTILPKIRLKVLDELINFDDISNDYQVELLHKWCLACVKNGGREKARRKLNSLLKNGKISKEICDFETRTINEIAKRMTNNELPTPKTHRDFARNFADVTSKLNDASKEFNAKLIGLLDGMARNIQPSEMGGLRGMQLFIV
jgi:hypothetical protein